MSDERLRRAERAALASGGRLEDRAAVLRERLRAGEVPVWGLRLAAFLGDEVAQAMLGEDAPGVGRPPIAAWLAGLEPWSPLVHLRAAVAAGRHALEHVGADWRSESAEPGLLAVERWIVERTPARREETLAWVRRQPVEWVRLPLEAVRGPGGPRRKRTAAYSIRTAALYVRDDQALIAAITAELLPWALGLADPVAERARA